MTGGVSVRDVDVSGLINYSQIEVASCGSILRSTRAIANAMAEASRTKLWEAVKWSGKQIDRGS